MGEKPGTVWKALNLNRQPMEVLRHGLRTQWQGLRMEWQAFRLAGQALECRCTAPGQSGRVIDWPGRAWLAVTGLGKGMGGLSYLRQG